MRIRNRSTILRAKASGWRPSDFRGRRSDEIDPAPATAHKLPDYSWTENRQIPFIEPSRASRIPRSKRRGSSTGFVIDPFRCRQIFYESGLEEQAINVLIADPYVVLIEEQLPAVALRHHDGSGENHWLDLRVTTVDGLRTGIAVKYADEVGPSHLRRTISLYAAQAREATSDGRTVPVADRYRIMTERHLDAVRVGNAAAVVSAGADFDFEGQTLVRRWLQQEAPRRFALHEIGRSTGLGSRGYRAALALVQSGAIGLPNERVSPAVAIVNHLAVGVTE